MPESMLNARFEAQLQHRNSLGLLRNLQQPNKQFIDFYSNDYLGISGNQELKQHILQLLQRENEWALGATGSRLVSGNYSQLEELENDIENWFGASGSVFFPSAYLANIGLLGALGGRHHTYLLDEHCHASIKEGVRLSFAKKYTFRHNNVEHLKSLLQKAQTNAVVVTEALFSMDGDFAPLVDISALCREYGAILVVDEAHAAGIYGQYGEGLVKSLGLSDDHVLRVVGFGKGFGQSGGAILGPSKLKKWAINFCLPAIYSTAPSPLQVLALRGTLSWLRGRMGALLFQFQKQVNANNQAMQKAGFHPNEGSPIQRIVFQSADKAVEVAHFLRQHGYGVKAILPPTVPQGKAIIRLTWKLGVDAEPLFQMLNQIKHAKPLPD